MIIVRVYGGLGNQLFQYAIGKKFSIKQQKVLKLDIYDFDKYKLRNFELFKFKINCDIANKKEIAKYRIENKILDKICSKLSSFGFRLISEKYYEQNDYVLDTLLLKNHNIKYLQGYWQSYKYFDDIRDILSQEFSLKCNLGGKNLEILHMIQSSNSISIHIRRGDYLKHSIYEKLSINYYLNAVKYINDRVENAVFFVFSDDLTWVKKNLNLDNAIYVGVNNADSAEYDLELMKNCQHNIIANSSFSWWAAWLNSNKNKIVITPNRWVTYIDNLDDLLPSDWIRIDI